MNYREILTEEAAEQFRKEGATHIVLEIYGDVDLLRTIEVRLDKGIFCVAGKTVRAAAAMEKRLFGKVIDSKRWYPFDSTYKMRGCNPDRVLADIAKVTGLDPTELEWSFIED